MFGSGVFRFFKVLIRVFIVRRVDVGEKGKLGKVSWRVVYFCF